MAVSVALPPPMSRLARPTLAASVVALGATLGGCVFASLSRSQELSGEVRGLWDGAGEVAIRVTSDRSSFVTTQARNGEIAFARTLPAGAAYTVSIDESPPEHACSVTAGASGIATPEGAELITVTCIGPDAQIELGGAWGWSFDRVEEIQAFAGSVLTQQVTLTLQSAEAGMTAQRDGQAVALATPITVPLAIGETPVTVVFTHVGGLSKTYQLEFSRGTKEPELVKELTSSQAIRAIAIEGELLAYAARTTLGPTPSLVVHERTSHGWSPGVTTTISPRIGGVGEPAVPLSVHRGVISLVQGNDVEQHTRMGPGTFSVRTDGIPRSNFVSAVAAVEEDLYAWSASGSGTTGCASSATPHTMRKLTLRTTNEVVCRRPGGHGTLPAVLAVNDTRVFALESGLDEIHVLDRNLSVENSINTPSGISEFRAPLAALPGLVAARAMASGNASVVEVFVPMGNGWMSAARLAPATPTTTFGTGLAISKGVLAAGDPAGSGAVYVYVGAGASWQAAKVVTPGATSPGFGALVALSEDTLVVASSSAVYIYR